ncbi:MFS transporter [Sporomusa aerivorans]|uniref:MFS transporter n=1 Tax=Sporomusa aerivorans TaxID=204936 RepID=UPI00352A9BE7
MQTAKDIFNKTATGKYLAFTLLYLGWCISYIDRAAMNIALASIGKEFSLNPASMGVVLSTFFIGYAIMQLPGGWMADKFGSKKIVIGSLLLWSVFTAFTGLAWSLGALIVIRLLFGLGEGAFPCASFKGIAEYFPKSERPKMIGALLSSNYIGSAIAPLVIAPLLMYLGWRQMFFTIGIAGIVFIAVYWFLIKPAKVQEEEEQKAAGAPPISAKELLKIPLMWQLVIAWFALSLINKGLDSWMPTYLLTVRHLDLKSIGLLTPLPFVAAGLATAMGGWVMDKLFDGREKYLLVTAAALTAFFLYFMYTAETAIMVIAFQSLVYFFKSFVLAGVMAMPMKMLPGTVVGSATGMINVGGQSAGFVSPIIIGFMISAFNGSYDAVFWFLISCACLSAISSLTIKKGDKLPGNTKVAPEVC